MQEFVDREYQIIVQRMVPETRVELQNTREDWEDEEEEEDDLSDMEASDLEETDLPAQQSFVEETRKAEVDIRNRAKQKAEKDKQDMLVTKTNEKEKKDKSKKDKKEKKRAKKMLEEAEAAAKERVEDVEGICAMGIAAGAIRPLLQTIFAVLVINAAFCRV